MTDTSRKDKLALLAEEIERKKQERPQQPMTFDDRFTWDEFYRDAAFNHPVSG